MLTYKKGLKKEGKIKLGIYILDLTQLANTGTYKNKAIRLTLTLVGKVDETGVMA